MSETEQLVSVLGALLTECERVRAMGEAAAGRLRHMINDLEGCSPRQPADSPVGDAPRKEPRTISTPAPSLQGIRLEKLEKSAPESSKVAIKHGLVVVGAVAFATLWALGIVAEVPQRPVTTTLYPEESTEIHEPIRPPAAQTPSSAKPERVTGRTVAPAAASSPQTSFTPVKPDTDLPPITAGFTSRGFFSRIGQARAAKEIIRSGPDVEQGATDGNPASRPSEPSPRRGPSPETP